LFVSFWYHAQCTCSSYVFLLCGQWHLSMKNTTEKFHKKVYQIPDRAKTEAETMRQSRGRGSKIETEARPSQLKKLPRGRLEPRQMPRGLHPWWQQMWLVVSYTVQKWQFWQIWSKSCCRDICMGDNGRTIRFSVYFHLYFTNRPTEHSPLLYKVVYLHIRALLIR